MFPSKPGIHSDSRGFIHVAAAIILNHDGQVLLVRKRGTRAFMLPGGKIEAGEQPAATLAREIAEEIDCSVASAKYLGDFEASAANEAGWRVKAALFETRIEGVPVATAEIDALLWHHPDAPADLPLAPLLALHAMRLARIAAAR